MSRRSIIPGLLTIFLLVGFDILAQGTWKRLDVPTTEILNTIFFTDSLNGWIAGNGGTIIHTTDGGTTWEVQESATTNDIVDIFFLNSQQGWATSFNYTVPPYGTLLLKTTDGGATWNPEVFPIPELFITCILFRDPQNGWAGGKPHAILKTSDGGLTWTQAAIDTSTLAFFPVLDIQFWDDQYGYASGGIFDVAGVVWHTSDGGNLWHALDPMYAPADEVHALHIFDSLHVMGAGGDPDFGYGVGMIRSADGGVTWTYDELGIQGYAADLGFRTPKECWAPLGPGRKLIWSMDTGKTWNAVATPDTTEIYRLVFPDSLHGYATGHDGAVLKFVPQPGLGEEENMRIWECRMSNYPNPFTEQTEIRFTLDTRTRVVITVYNVMGEALKALVDDDLMPGSHTVTFDGSGLPGGVYLARLVADDGNVSVLPTVLVR